MPDTPHPDPIPTIIHFGSITLFSGASGSGKTRFKAAWCKAWLAGEPILGFPTNKPTGLYYLAVDRPWSPTYEAAFTAAGVSEDITSYALCDDPKYDPRCRLQGWQSCQLLDACLDKLDPQPGGLVFIDPYAPLFISGNQNNAIDVALSLHHLRQVVRKRQITVICDANVAKMRIDEDFRRAVDRVSGSGAFLAYADTVFNLTEGDKPKDRPQEPHTLVWAPRMAAPGYELFTFDPKTQLFVRYDGVRDEGDTPENDRPTLLLTLLPEEGAKFEDWLWIAQTRLLSPSYSQSTFQRDVKKLMKRGLVLRDGWGHYSRVKLT